jgi:hypothetical protein
MARGGKREGAGRKPGAPNIATAKREAEVKASGLTPLEYMLSVLRDQGAKAEDRMWAAEKAAPYVHPKLASVDHKSSDGTMTPKPDRIVIEAADDDGDDQASS